MEWVQKLYELYVRRTFKWKNCDRPTREEVQQRFEPVLSALMVTVLVQEPWHGTVCFKGLAHDYADEVGDLIADPMIYLLANFGGGKFKLNFHHGWNFVATVNFKPQGESKWQDMPGIDF